MHRTHAGRLLGALLLLSTTACGAGFRVALRSAPPAVAPEDVAARLALGPGHGRAAADGAREIERLLSIAELAVRTEPLPAVVDDALHAAVARARLEHALHPGEPAHETLRIAERRAMIVARDAMRPSLVVEIAADAIEPPMDVVEEALFSTSGSRSDLLPLWARLSEPARAWAEIIRSVPRGAERASLAAIAAHGGAAVATLEDRLEDAVVVGDLDEIERVAAAMLRADPHSTRAQAITIAAREIAAGLLPDRAILRDVASASPRPDAWPFARLLSAHDAVPGSAGVVLALAIDLLEADAAPDALDVVSPLRDRAEASGEARRSARLVAALASFELGDVEPWRALVRDDGSVESSVTTSRIVCRDRGDGATDAQAVAARSARRARVDAGSRVESYLRAVASDDETPEATRRLAIERLALVWPAGAHALVSCVAEHLEESDCEGRLELLDVLEESDLDPSGLDATYFTRLAPDLGDAVAGFLANVPATLLSDAARFLDSLAPTAHGLRATWILARASVAARAGDRARLEALLTERGAVLDVGARALLRAAIADLGAGRAVEALSIDPAFLAPIPLPPPIASAPATEASPTGATAALACLEHAYMHRLEHVQRCLGVAATALEVDEPGFVAAQRSRVGVASLAAGDLEALLSLAETHDAGSNETAFVRALLADARDPAEASSSYAALLAAPRGALPALVAASERGGRAGRPIADLAAIASAAPGLAPRSLRALVERGELTDAAVFAALLRRDPDTITQHLALLATTPGFEVAVDFRLQAAIGAGIDAGTGADARALAASFLPAARAREREASAGRAVAAVLAALARDGEAFEAITHRPAADRNDSAPVAFDDILPEVVRLGGRIDDDAMRTIVAALRESSVETPIVLARAGLATDPEFTTLLCMLLVSGDQAIEAAAVCTAAYLAAPSALLAARVSYAAAEAPDAVRAAGLDPAAFFGEAVERWDTEAHGIVAWNAAVTILESDRTRAASLARIAQEHGYLPSGVSSWELAQAETRGLELRFRSAGSASQPQGLDRAYTALAEGRVDIAGAYLDVLFRETDDETLSSLAGAYLARDLVHWAAADLEHGRLDAAGVAEEERIRTSDLRGDGIVDLSDRYPESSLVMLGVAVHGALTGDSRLAAERAIALLERDPRPTVLAALRTSIAGFEGRETTAERLEAIRRDFPDDPRLAVAVEEPLPAGLLTAEAAATLLGSATEADLARLEPTVRVSASSAAVAAFPSRATSHPQALGIALPGGAMIVQVEPRPSECEASQCLDVLVPALERTGLELVWRAEASIPAGTGGRFLMRAGDRLALFTVLPRGSRLYVLGIFGPQATVTSRLAAYALLERTFVPLDVVAPASWSARIVGTPAAPWTAYHRAVATLSTASPTATACPIRTELDALTDAAQRAELVRVLYLGEGEPGRRRALLSCADADAAPDGLLGLASAVDPDPGARRLGLPHLRGAPGPAVAVLTESLGDAVEPPLAGVPHRESDLPVFGLVEAILALPEPERRALTRTMWERNEPRLRVLVGMADEVLPGSLDHAILRDALRTGTVADALALTGALYQSEDETDFDAARVRLDGLVAPFEEPERQLALTLGWLLARHLSAPDEARLRALGTRMSDAASALPEDTEERLRLSWTAEQLAHEADIVHASLARGVPDDEELAQQVEIYRGMRGLVRGHTSTAVARSLATESLARVLPGTHWSYVRVPSPSLLGATLQAMYARLESGSAADGAIARQALEWMLERSNADLLGDEGGLDMDRPIECATADRFPRAWVCAVYVRDADAVRAQLAQRRIGTNSGAWMIVEAASYARSLPIAAGAIPFELDEIMHADGPAPSSRLGAVLARERARTEVDLDGVRVERYATFAAREGDAPSVDTEHYLFTGDRLVMFGLEETARVILAAPRPLARTLAGTSAFRELTDGWSEGAVLQLVNVDYRDRMLPSPLPHDDFGLEVVATDDGLVARIRMPLADTRTTGVEELLARLPDGPISTLAFVPDDELPPTDPETAPEGLAWQSLVIARSERFALGWYGASEEAVWDRWLVALRPTERLRTLLSGWSLLPDAGATRSANGVVLGLTADGALVVGTDEAMVRDALGRAPAAGARTEIGAAHLDGLLAAEVARRLAEGIRSEDPRRESLLFLGAMLGLARDIGFSAAADDEERELVLSAHVSPNLGEAGEEHTIVDGALRDARNGVTLPRAPTPAELTRPVRLVVETTEPDVVATRAFGGSPRVRAEPQAGGLLWVTIAPTSSDPIELGTTERARLLSSPSWLRSDAASVRTLAGELAPSGTAPDAAARTIVRWVHENVRYELTAAELDAPTVLERRVGDCSELARITVALLRASGVPAEIREGFLVTGADLGAHAWVAYHDGTTFREIDPTAGRAEVDAGYIPSSVLTVMGLAALGELRITEVVRGD